MQLNTTTIAGTAILWLGTLIGAFHQDRKKRDAAADQALGNSGLEDAQIEAVKAGQTDPAPRSPETCPE